MVVNQWVPAAHRGDAVGDSARRLQVFLRGMGHAADVYALAIDDDLVGDVRPFADPVSCAGDVTILHFAVPSPMSAAFAALPRGRVLQYHNVTPARFFAPYDKGLARMTARGRQELASLAGHVDLALGVSEFNRLELEALGFEPTGIMPVAVDLDRITRAPRQLALEAALDDDKVNILFVGRLAPHKRIEDYVCLARVYEQYVDDRCRFIFVGRTDGVPAYYARIWALIDRYNMKPERFLFTGAVTDDELAAYYRTADVYLSMSEHEGFSVPLVEAMAADVPIVAYASTAVPETLGGAGVLFWPKDLEYAAELVEIVADDEDVRAAVLAGQRARLAYFNDARIAGDLATVLARVAA
jgi:glycosyltransferase involved in cell wall biosynthesis